jgi:RNA polymerase sigma-70 factor (ECF subfamily)
VIDRRDEDLLAAARAGDERAIGALVERYQPKVYRFGMKMCGQHEDAEDIVQETLLAMARNVKDFRGKSSLATWLYAIARSFCIKKRRRSKSAPAEPALDLQHGLAIADPGEDPETALAGKRLQSALDAVMQTLDPKYREVFVLRDVEGLTAREVSEVMELGVPAIKSRLHRARAMVRSQMAPFLNQEESASPPGSDCPDIVDLFSKHLEGDIKPTLCAEMEQHLERCAPCRGTCDTLKETLALCRSAPEPEVSPALKASVKTALRGFLATRIKDLDDVP